MPKKIELDQEIARLQSMMPETPVVEFGPIAFINGRQTMNFRYEQSYDITRGTSMVETVSTDQIRGLKKLGFRRLKGENTVTKITKQHKRLDKRRRLYVSGSTQGATHKPGSMNRHKSVSIKGEK